jgi:GntR family transcriptional repressor for pyruvate dehydrogenase complex
MNFPVINRRRLSTEVAEHLEQQILNGEIAEGTRLPSEKDLGASFGVSRNAIREALKTLEERGLVRVENGRGAYVTAPSEEMLRAAITRYVQSRLTLDTVHEFYQVREALEGAAARLAATRASDHDLEALAAALATMEAYEGNVDGWMQGDVAFHRALIGATHNPFFITLLEPVTDRLREAIRVSFNEEGARMGLACHAEILRCMRNRDPAGTHEAMMATLQDSARRVTRALEQEEGR